MAEETEYISHFFYLQDIKAYHSLPLPGYVVNPVSLIVQHIMYVFLCFHFTSLSLSLSLSLSQDEGSFTIRLLHPSKKKELGDAFKVEDTSAFNK